MVEWGVTPIIRYDSIDRVVRTDLPDGTFTKVEFDAWSQTSFDQNDTCRHPTDPAQHSQWYIDRGTPDPNGSEPSDPDSPGQALDLHTRVCLTSAHGSECSLRDKRDLEVVWCGLALFALEHATNAMGVEERG